MQSICLSELMEPYKSSEYPYLRCIRSLRDSGRHEDLHDLTCWMEATIEPKPRTSVCLRGGLKTISQDTRTKTAVTFLEHKPNMPPSVTSLIKAEDLERALLGEVATSTTIQTDSAQECTLKIFLVEDLSTDVMEIFGSRFGIDPLFFGNHFNSLPLRMDYRSERTTSYEPMRLNATKRSRNWFTLENVRLLEFFEFWFPDETTERQSRMEALSSVRDPNMVRTLGYCPLRHGLDRWQDPLVPTRTSFWIDEDRHDHNALVVIVLVDPTPGSSWADPFRDECISISRISLRERSPSWCERIVDLTIRCLESHPSTTSNAIENMVIMYPTVMTICAEWLYVCQKAEEYLDWVDALFETRSGDIAADIDRALSGLDMWSRHIQTSKRILTRTLQDVLPMAIRLVAKRLPQHKGQKNKDMIDELKDILRDLDEIQKRVDRLIDRGRAEMQLTAARESLMESHNLARLTWLATIFIPLTFLSGLFSIDSNLGSLANSFKTYFELAIPLAIAALSVARYGGTVIRTLRRMFHAGFFRFRRYRYERFRR
jgi:hypothetical protein